MIEQVVADRAAAEAVVQIDAEHAQAGQAGYDRWSGTQRALSSFADKAGQDIVLTMTGQDFLQQGKKRNQIEVVGLQLNPHGSTVTAPITLKSITVNLPETDL